MAVIVDFRMTGRDLPLLDAFTGVPDVTVTLDTVVPFADGVLPYVWAEGDRETFVRSLRDDPRVESLTAEADCNGRTLYRVEWSSEFRETVRELAESRGALLAATSDRSGWRYRLRFPDQGDISRYVRKCDEHDLDVEIERISEMTDADGNALPFDLTPKQWEAVELAARRGYFESPRGVSLSELASHLGISQQAVSQRLRRAVNQIVTSVLRTPNGPGAS